MIRMDQSTSPKYSLNKADLFKALRGLVVVLAGAALTYVADMIPNVDFGMYTPLVVSVSSTLIELGRRFLTDYQGA